MGGEGKMNLMENVEKVACPLLKLKQAEKRVHITTHFDRQFFSDLCILRIDGKRKKKKIGKIERTMARKRFEMEDLMQFHRQPRKSASRVTSCIE